MISDQNDMMAQFETTSINYKYLWRGHCSISVLIQHRRCQDILFGEIKKNMKQLLVFVGVLMVISSVFSLENKTNDKKFKKHEKRGILNYGFGLSQEQNHQYQIYGTPQQQQPQQDQQQLQINEQNIPDHSNENNHHHVFQQDHQNHILLPQNIPHVHPIPVAPVPPVPFALPQPVPILPPVVPQTIIKPVPYPVHVEKIVDRPYPVAVPVPKYIDRPVAVPVEKHIHVPVDRPYAVPVFKDRPVPYPVHVAVPVLKPYPVPVAVQYKTLPHHHLHHHQGW